MSAGLFGLLDDVAALAKLAAASVDDVGAASGRATAKAAGVVVDDTAVTPQYVRGVAAERELPIVRKIAVGSLRNKLLVILPVALLLSAFAPWLLPVILILGGTYLAFEGAEKLWEARPGAHGHHGGQGGDEEDSTGSEPLTAEAEKRLVGTAVRTDFILSAEIMVIALDSVADQPLLSRAVILAVVAVVITVLVYGVVALIVKMDDVGLALAERSSAAAQRVGRALVAAMPRLLAVISVVGVVAMLWVGGHILLAQSAELGWHAPLGAVHHVEDAVEEALHGVAWLGAVLAWLLDTAVSAVVGVVVGGAVLLVVHQVHRLRGH